VVVVVSLLEVALRVGVLLVFPAVAVMAWRKGGAGRLRRAALIGIAVIFTVALYVATPASGNALVRTRGYGYTIPASLLLHGLTLAAPVVATAVGVGLVAPRLASALGLYGIGVLVAGLTWIAGIAIAMSILYR
jgi:hypothetical protein